MSNAKVYKISAITSALLLLIVLVTFGLTYQTQKSDNAIIYCQGTYNVFHQLVKWHPPLVCYPL